MAESATFWDRKADGYARKPVKDRASYEQTLEATRERLSPGHRVLELGCGTGSTALVLAPLVERYTATDVSSRMVEIARQKAAAQPVPGLRFEHTTLDDGRLDPGPYDAVLAFHLLHLLEDLPAALARIHALLEPGGLFVSKTACLSEWSRLFVPLLTVMRWLGLAPFVRCLTAGELEAAIAAAGFEILETDFQPRPARLVVARRT